MSNLLKFLFSSCTSKAQSTLDSEAVGLGIETLEDRVMLSSVQIFASGESGGEILELYIDGGLRAGYSTTTPGEIEEFEYETANSVSASDIEIQFTNDLFDPANGVDRNLTIDRIVIDGVTFETEASNVYSVGTYSGENLVSGYGLGDTLYGNGRFKYGTDSANASTLTVYALGITNEERFNVRVKGRIVSSFSTSQQRGMTPNEVVVNGPYSPSDVSVEFINDLYLPEQGIDRNLIVDRIVKDGVSYQTESPRVLSSGTYIEGQGISTGYFQTEILHANGSFTYSDSDIDVTPPEVTLENVDTNITDPRTSDVGMSIVITDDIGAVFPLSGASAISVVSPSGERFPVREIVGSTRPDGSKAIFYQFFKPDGAFGPFTADDNGTWEIYLNDNRIADAAGNFAAEKFLGTFEINITTEIEDVDPPEVYVVYNEYSVATDGELYFDVEFFDFTELGTILDPAFIVYGPNFYEFIPTLVGGIESGDEFSEVRTYRLPPNGGSWGPEDSGEYIVYLNDGIVTDAAGNTTLGQTIGSFTLSAAL